MMNYGAPTRTRTADLLITNQLFCFFIINLNGLFQTMPVDIEFHDRIKRTSLINRPSISFNSRVSLACDADRIAEHFLILHKAKIADRFETAMKDKRYESDSA